MKGEGTAEETAPIYESSLEESPESKEDHMPPPAKEIIRINPSTVETPPKAIDLIGEGPHTSTPKYIPDNSRVYKSLPRGVPRPTPTKPYDGRYSVRRRLPYDEIPEKNESLFQVSPVSTGSKGMHSKMNIDLSPLEKRASSHRRIMESPNFKNRLHPTDSTSDIPYADSVDDIWYDDSPKTKISKENSVDFTANVSLVEKPKTKVSRGNSVDFSGNACFDEISKATVSRGNSVDFSENVSFDERPKTKVSRGSQADLTDISFDERPKTVSRGSQSDVFEDVSFDDKPRRRITRTKTLDSTQDISHNGWSRRKITRANTVVMRPRQRERCFSDPSDEKPLGSLPEMRTYSNDSVDERSSSEPSLRLKRAMSCRLVQKDTSPMEEEENESLDWHAKQMNSPDDSTVTFSPYA